MSMRDHLVSTVQRLLEAADDALYAIPLTHGYADIAELVTDGLLTDPFAKGQLRALLCHDERTVEELAAEQGVQPVTDPDQLAADEPLTDTEYDDFMAALREARDD